MFYLTMVVYLLAMWSYFASAFTMPGVVPLYWGIYSEKVPGERKYCLVCHNFKPERAHHCSKCQVCVLNMDHHCPWINNCVGFDNRKAFVLFITYLLIALIMAVTVMIIVIIKDCQLIVAGKASFDFNMVLKILLFIFYGTMALTLFFFVITHFKSVCHNSTTLE
jgi:palmitoyltransferase ZDHHC2/15/20